MTPPDINAHIDNTQLSMRVPCRTAVRSPPIFQIVSLMFCIDEQPLRLDAALSDFLTDSSHYTSYYILYESGPDACSFSACTGTLFSLDTTQQGSIALFYSIQ